MSKTKVKILSTPKTKQDIPQINPFSVPSEMQYGGARPDKGPYNNDSRYPNMQVLDTTWDWMKNGRTTNPSASTSKTLSESANPDIVVEKKEKVLGDFNGDGMPVLMGVNAGTHKSGQDMGISVPSNSFIFSDTKNLTIKNPDMLKQFGGTKPSTPAQLAAKYDLVKYKAVIDNPKADELDKKTAQFNYQSAVNKLNALSSVQENMKMNKGIPSAITPMPQQRYGGMYQSGGDYTGSFPTNSDLSDDYTVTAQRNPDIWGQSTGPVMMPTDISATNPFGSVDVPNSPDPIYGTTNTSAAGDVEKGVGMGALSTINNPDTMRNLQWALRAASYPNYSPTRQIAKGYVPESVFLDPTRSHAALSEQANNAAYIASQSGNGPISRANALAYSSKAGELAGNIEGEYANKNSEIANRSNQIAADVRNRVWEQQQGYNKNYSEEVANQLKDRFGFNTAMSNEYLKGMYEDRARSVAAHNYNYINPYFTEDEQGYIHPKSKELYKAYQSIGNNSGGMGGDSFEKKLAVAKGYRDRLIASGYSAEYADKQSSRLAGFGEYESTTYDTMNPMKQKIRESGIPVQKYGGSIKRKVRILSTP